MVSSTTARHYKGSISAKDDCALVHQPASAHSRQECEARASVPTEKCDDRACSLRNRVEDRPKGTHLSDSQFKECLNELALSFSPTLGLNPPAATPNAEQHPRMSYFSLPRDIRWLILGAAALFVLFGPEFLTER